MKLNPTEFQLSQNHSACRGICWAKQLLIHFGSCHQIIFIVWISCRIELKQPFFCCFTCWRLPLTRNGEKNQHVHINTNLNVHLMEFTTRVTWIIINNRNKCVCGARNRLQYLSFYCFILLDKNHFDDFQFERKTRKLSEHERDWTTGIRDYWRADARTKNRNEKRNYGELKCALVFDTKLINRNNLNLSVWDDTWKKNRWLDEFRMPFLGLKYVWKQQHTHTQTILEICFFFHLWIVPSVN